MPAKIISMPSHSFWTGVRLVKPLILEVLTDDYLYSIQELANDIESDRETVQAALRELLQEGKVLTMRRRWARS
jgi:hypothetical protein